jgi:hypothetical protein
MTWIDEQDSTKIENVMVEIRKLRDANAPAATECFKQSHGDDNFALWLYLTNMRAMRRLMISIFDLADCTWSDMFDSGLSPREALDEALSQDDLYSMMGD